MKSTESLDGFPMCMHTGLVAQHLAWLSNIHMHTMRHELFVQIIISSCSIGMFRHHSKGNISVLALQHLSSAFDTFDQTILSHRLHTVFVSTNSVFQWSSSYLADRTLCVYLCNKQPVAIGLLQAICLNDFLI